MIDVHLPHSQFQNFFNVCAILLIYFLWCHFCNQKKGVHVTLSTLIINSLLCTESRECQIIFKVLNILYWKINNNERAGSSLSNWQWGFSECLKLSSRQCNCVHKCNTIGLTNLHCPLSVPKVIGVRAAVPIVELGKQRVNSLVRTRLHSRVYSRM